MIEFNAPHKKRIFAISLIFTMALCVFPVFTQELTASQYFDLGLEAQNAEKWYLASQHFLEAVQKNPVYVDAYLHLAQCSYQLGEFELCLDQLDLCEKYAKEDNAINNLRGMTYIALARFSDARAIFEKILKKTPNNVDARFGLAELDLFDGKITGAEKQYSEVLKRQTSNRKALLSLAVVSAQLGKFDKAEHYLKQAIGNYSDEAEVHYLAAIIYSMKNDLKAAEKRCRVAVELDGNYDKAYELLSKIQFEQGFYDEVVSICDFRIGRNRNHASAWYLKGAAQKELNKTKDAISTWSRGLDVAPEDEVMRAALELLVNKTVPLEDNRRANWASYHTTSAKECESRYDNAGATYEYQRALKINPSNETARMAYASMLELNGMHELYLEQLLFIVQNRALGETSGNAQNKPKSIEEKRMNDTIEAYTNLLQDSLAKKWNVQPFYLDKTRWNLGIYYIPSTVNQLHVKNNTIAAEFAADIFSGIASASVAATAQSVKGFGDAYQKARTSGMDYFVILSIDESERDVTLDYTFYSGKTGNKIRENSLYATANMRYSNVFRRFRSEILENLTIRGKIIARQGKTLLADIGRSENIRNGAVFDVVRKNSVRTASKGTGVSYNDEDILGKFTVTTCSEEVSEGTLDFDGFYDRVNTGDELVLISMPPAENTNTNANGANANGAGTGGNGAGGNAENNGTTNANVTPAPAANANGQPIAPKSKISTDLNRRRVPSFIELIRSIY